MYGNIARIPDTVGTHSVSPACANIQFTAMLRTVIMQWLQSQAAVAVAVAAAVAVYQ